MALPTTRNAGGETTFPSRWSPQILAALMAPPPRGFSHWSTGLLAKRFGLGRTVIHKILHANQLKPHQHRTFKIGKDPRFAEKALDVVGL